MYGETFYGRHTAQHQLQLIESDKNVHAYQPCNNVDKKKKQIPPFKWGWNRKQTICFRSYATISLDINLHSQISHDKIFSIFISQTRFCDITKFICTQRNT